MTEYKDNMDSKKKRGFSLRLTDAELKEQVEKYHKLKITKSARGVAVLIVSALIILSFLLAAVGAGDVEELAYGLIIYVPVLYFVYKGSRIALFILMALVTIEKFYQVFLVGSVTPLIWWALIMIYLVRALQVENARKKSSKKET